MNKKKASFLLLLAWFYSTSILFVDAFDDNLTMFHNDYENTGYTNVTVSPP